MGALLTSEWLDGGEVAVLEVSDEASLTLARGAIRAVAADIGLVAVRLENLLAAATEILCNQLRHARGGEVAIRPTARGAVAGIEVLARDAGDGIADAEALIRSLPRTGGSLGVGLQAAYRQADEVDFDVRRGEGTTAVLRTFCSPVPRSEIAILGLLCEGERISGDDGAWHRTAGAVTVAVIDGLGHGAPAREASARAASLVRKRHDLDPTGLIEQADKDLVSTRGAVMAACRLEHGNGRFLHAGVGNITAAALAAAQVHRLGSAAGIVGQKVAGKPLSVFQDTRTLDGRRTIILASDGLSSRVVLGIEAPLLRQPPLVIAQRLLAAHGRSHDDALIAVLTG